MFYTYLAWLKRSKKQSQYNTYPYVYLHTQNVLGNTRSRVVWTLSTWCLEGIQSHVVFKSGEFLLLEIHVGNTIELTWPSATPSVFKCISITNTKSEKKVTNSNATRVDLDCTCADPCAKHFVCFKGTLMGSNCCVSRRRCVQRP